MESIQHKLDRVRPPRVQITYDVETGGAIQKKELPFVVGVMADLSGKPAEPLPPLKQRKFVEIDRDNFNDVMYAAKPRVAFQVENKLANDGTKLNIELNFRSMEDFEPVNIVKQVEPLRKLLEARSRLRDLLAKLDGNDSLDALLREVVDNTAQQEELKKALQASARGDGKDGEGKDGDAA
jgi:type VI secretion protein, VC_A0107 family